MNAKVSPLQQLLTQLVQAPTWTEAQRLVTEHPEMLSNKADVQLNTTIAIWQQKQNAKVVALLTEYRTLLQHCREIVVENAFVEKIGRQDAEGTRFTVPIQFKDDLDQAQESEQQFERTGDVGALDAAIAAGGRIVSHPSFATASIGFQIAAMDVIGTKLMRRYQLQKRVNDLEQALYYGRLVVQKAPLTAPELPVYLNSLGTELRAAYDQSGEIEDLAEAIRVHQEAVKATPPDSPDLPKHLNNLGKGLNDRYACLGRLEDLNDAINSFREAVKLTPPNSYKRPSRLIRLADSLHTRYGNTLQPEDLDDAIRTYQEAIRLSPADSPDLPTYLNDLSIVLRTSYEDRKRVEDLEEAISISHQAVRLTVSDSHHRPSCLKILGNGLRTRYEHTGRMEDLEEAILVCQEAVRLSPSDSCDLPSYLNDLSIVLRISYEHRERVEDLKEAISISRQAVSLTSSNSYHRPSYLNGLGNGLRTDYERIGRLEDLEESINAYQEAVRLIPPNSPNLPIFLSNLGNGLRNRYARTGRMEDLEEAIQVYQEAVRLTPRDSTDRFILLSHLGSALANRYAYTRQMETLEEAISISQEAVRLALPGSPKRPLCLNNLGNTLYTRYEHTGRLEDLEEAIHVIQDAEKLTPHDSPDRASRLNNLANSLRSRFMHTKQQANLDEAIRVYQQAVGATPPNSPNLPMYLNNLGNGLRDRFGCAGQKVDLKEAIQVYRRACKLGILSAPQATLGAARNWGRWAVRRKNWDETAEAYGYGLATGRQILARQLQRAQKENTLRDLQEMSAPAAYALTKRNKLEEAVATMERGRARLLAEALERSRRDLERLPTLGYADLYQRYQEVVMTQEHLTQPAEARLDQPVYLTGQARLDAIITANLEFDQVVSDIQKVPGYTDFLAEPTFTQIQTVTQDTPLVYLLSISAGGLALIVHNGSTTPVWLDKLTTEALSNLLNQWRTAYSAFLTEQTASEREAWFVQMETLTQHLWNWVMEPIAVALGNLGLASSPVSQPSNITLIPAGLLALLPLHAAWHPDPATPTGRRYFLDEFTVSYAPSALALRHARAAATTQPTQNLLAIDEPKPVHAPPLPNVQAEVDAIAALFETPVVKRHEQANLKEIREELLPADVVHFACHGANDRDNPLESGLCMAHDQLLTVRDLLGLEHAAGRLAVLSACETGIVGIELPDEVVALPSALLQVGFGGVVASLWSVADVSTAMLMARFYEYWHNEGLTPVHALRAAQCWLRDTSNRQKEAYFEQFSPARSGVHMPGMHMPEAVALAFVAKAKTLDMKKETFAHPYWWAAFYLTGV